MNSLIPFTFEHRDVRVVMIDGLEWWVGQDVAVSLGYKNPRDAMCRHCKGVVKYYPLQTAGGEQEVRIINEGDVFRLITHSSLPEAQRFEKWLFEEVLPQIRKSGSYGTNAGELKALRESLMLAKSQRDTYQRLWLAERKTVLRFEQRSFLTREDKREILTLYCRDYPLSAIQRITKKGRTRITNFINEILRADEDTRKALFARWEQDDEARAAASRDSAGGEA